MREIKQLADRITVLRDGRLVGSRKAAEVSESELLEMMTGRKIEFLFPTITHKPGEKVLQTTGLTVSGVVANVDFHARAGEITGIAGLVGCGKSELDPRDLWSRACHLRQRCKSMASAAIRFRRP